MKGGLDVREAGAGLVTGGGESQVQVGSEDVDVSRYAATSPEESVSTTSAEAPVAPGAPAPVADAGSFVDSALSDSSVGNRASEQQTRREVQPMSRTTMLSSDNQQNTRTASTPMSSGSASVPASIAASAVSSGGLTRDTMQPSMHPGTPLVLNMQSGKVSAGGSAAPVQEQAQTQTQGSNELEGSAQPASRAKYTPDNSAPIATRTAERVSDEKQRSAQDRQRREMEAAGRVEIRREGVVEKPKAPKTLTRANRTFKKIREIVQDKVKTTLHGKSFSGMSFYETIFSKPDLMPHCVSIGVDNVIESIREPNSGLLQLVNQKFLEANPNEQAFTVEECLSDITRFVNEVNKLNIEVVLDKSPVNINHSVQVRTLRIHYGRGIGLHPTQTKAFNADYDGDPAVINLDQSQLVYYARAMDRLVTVDGSPLIDPDFFPLDPIDESEKKDVVKILKQRNLSWDPGIADSIIDAYLGACNKGDWVGFLRKIDDIADKRAEFFDSRNEISSAILKSLYDFSIDYRSLRAADTLDNMNEEHSNFAENFSELVSGADPFVIDLVNLTDEIVSGRSCPSLQEFTRFYNKYYGDVRGKKNVPFRLLADFAKAINRTDMITIGSDLFGIDAKGKQSDDAQVSIYDLWQFTCAAGLTKQISGRCYMGSRELAVSTQVRSMVLSECPIHEWQSEEEFRDWVGKFKASYNLNMRMLNIAQTSFRSGMTPVRSKSSKFDGIGDKPEDLAEALVKVYGKFTVGKLFPTLIRGNYSNKENSGNTIARYYRNMPIDKFVMNNRLVFRSEGSVKKFQGIEQRYRNGTFDQMDVLLLIADRRTKQLGDYNEQWKKTTKDQFGAILDMVKYSSGEYSIEDYNEYAYQVMEVIETMSPDMFMHFGMDSPTTFKNSKWGKRLLGAESIEEYQTTLFSMMIEYRLGKSSAILQELSDVENAAIELEMPSIDQIELLDAAFENELEILGSSSMAWHTIAEETMNGSATFKMLIDTGGLYKDGSGTIWNMHARQRRVKNEQTGQYEVRGISFWDRPAEEKEKYYSLINFLKSSEPLDVKLAVLADVARVHEQYANMSPKEMLGQIAYHPDRLHAGNRFDMDKGIRGDIDAIKESAERLSSYRERTPERIKEEAQKIIDEAWDDKKAFEQHLNRLATDPGYAVHVDTILAADAIASVFDKTYDDSEKIHQQTLVNGYFGCVSYQRSGGYYTHLYMTDNAVVNMVGYDQLTPQDIVRVLADPDIEIGVYDEFGTASVISRTALCGGNTIDDVIRYLERNPRIALSCRRFMAGVSSDTEASARINALNDKTVQDRGLYRIFSLLNDRPRFLATAALVTPSDNNVGRNVAEEVNGSIADLCQLINYCAKSNLRGMELVQVVEKSLGLYPDTVLKLRKKGAFDEYEFDDRDYAAVADLYSEVVGEILDCIEVVQSSGVKLPNVDKPMAKRVDQTSMMAYYDARQQLSGARTETMIGVEGSETKKNLVLKTFLKGRPDAYTMSSDGKTVIPLIDGVEQASDMSLVHDPSRLTSSICKFLEIKREMGAETFNAKYKKFGDDGSNSMIKFIRMAKREVFDRFGKTGQRNQPNGTWSIEDGAELMSRIAQCESKSEAVPILAQALIDADIRLGYVDVNKDTGKIEDDAFVPSDYWNRANLMIGENSDGALVVRTLEQLSAACRTRLSDEAVTSGDINVVRAELEQIVASVGTDTDPMLTQNPREVGHRCLYGVRLHSSLGKKYRVDRALRPRSSSTERNYSLLYSIYKDFQRQVSAGEYIPSRKAIENLSNKMYQKLKNGRRPGWDPDVHKAIVDQLKGLAYPKDSWVMAPKFDYKTGLQIFDKNGNEVYQWESEENPYGNHDYIYDYLGTYDDQELQLIPGPTSLVLFEDDAESVDVNLFNARLSQCMQYGITAAFAGDCMNYLNEEQVRNLIKVSEDIWILPCFDMRLNGAFSRSIMEAPAEIPINPDNAVVNVEDTTGEFREGDATYHITKELADRIKVNFRKTATFTAERLFPNVMRMFPKADFEIDYCTNEEVQKYILNADFNVDTLTMEGFDEAVVDIGVMPGNPNFEREKRRFAIRLEEYKANFESSDQDSILKCDCRYDSIVGFVKIVNVNDGSVVLAPIWPFHLEESGSIPTVFAVDQFQLDHDTSSFNLDWVYTGGIEDQYIKAFEGIGASNKMITSGERARSRQLENGLAVDGFYSTKSVASRLFASNKRIHTMISAMMITRIDPNYAYNFAELSGSFPSNPVITREDGTQIDVKQAMLEASLGITDWQLIKEQDTGPGFYHVDPVINSIVRWWVNKCVDFGTVNPTTLLATKSSNGILWPKITEFEAFMDTGLKFQNSWMKLMHAMNPTLMPESIDANPKGCLFRPVTGNNTSDDYGVLQMRVPHFDVDDNQYWKPENVYISMGFFGSEFSGFKKVNFNAYNRSLDDLNVANEVDGEDLIQLLTTARSGMSSVQPSNKFEVVPDNAMQKAIPQYVESEPDNIHKRILDKKTWGKTLALTGHRPNVDKRTGTSKLWGWDMSDPHYEIVKQKLAEYCRKNHIDTIISGMAQGFDQLGAQVAIDNGLKLVAAVPMPGQEEPWKHNPESVERYYDLLGHADFVYYVSDERAKDQQDANNKLQDRNEWMVSNADEVFALYNDTPGGTRNAIRYARRTGKEPHILSPKEVNDIYEAGD